MIDLLSAAAAPAGAAAGSGEAPEAGFGAALEGALQTQQPPQPNGVTHTDEAAILAAAAAAAVAALRVPAAVEAATVVGADPVVPVAPVNPAVASGGAAVPAETAVPHGSGRPAAQQAHQPSAAERALLVAAAHSAVGRAAAAREAQAGLLAEPSAETAATADAPGMPAPGVSTDAAAGSGGQTLADAALSALTNADRAPADDPAARLGAPPDGSSAAQAAQTAQAVSGNAGRAGSGMAGSGGQARPADAVPSPSAPAVADGHPTTAASSVTEATDARGGAIRTAMLAGAETVGVDAPPPNPSAAPGDSAAPTAAFAASALQRVLDAAEAARERAPQSMAVDIAGEHPGDETLRLVVSVRGTTVHVSADGAGRDGGLPPAWGRELAEALRERGLELGGQRNPERRDAPHGDEAPAKAARAAIGREPDTKHSDDGALRL